MTQSLPNTVQQFPFAAGLQTRGDKRAKNPPALDIAKDVEFDDIDGLRTRYPYALSSASIFGGGTLSNVRKLGVNGDELLCWTIDSLYSWSQQQSKWVLRGTHLATKIDTTPRFVTTGDQVECDRAELNGTIVYALRDGTTTVYVAAIDKTTGAVLTGPTAVSGSNTRPRLVALSTKILLFTYETTTPTINVRAIDPADPATGIASAATNCFAGGTFASLYYDVVRAAGADYAIVAADRNPTTSYNVIKVTSALATTISVKGRTSGGSIGIACDPTGTYVMVCYGGVADLINASTLADVRTGTSVNSATGNHVACAFRSVQNGGFYRCYVFVDSVNTDPALDGFVKCNWVDTNGSTGTEITIANGGVGLGSCAFDANGSVFAHIVFAGVQWTGTVAALQNSYFLYRDDGFLVAKVLPNETGGFTTDGHLPGVVATSGVYSWCATDRRVVPTAGNFDAYADRGPRDVSITFDSNEARRGVRLGKTFYIAGGGGEVLQYDGKGLYEVGFHYYPYAYGIGTTGGGGPSAGIYSTKFTYRWQNGQGETERSTTALYRTASNSGAQDFIFSDVKTLTITHKTARPPAIEYWRTVVSPTADAPYYLGSDSDPTNSSLTNGYIANDSTVGQLFSGANYHDAMADTTLTAKETNPENGGVLESLAPPPAKLIAASETRLFLAGIPGDPDRVWYSKQRNDGEIAAFHDALTVPIPPEGGDITAIVISPDGTPVVFRETATYVLLNDGLDNAGGGQNFVARHSSHDFGAVSPESVAVIDTGIVFKSSKGWCHLNRAFSVDYIGAPIYAYDSETPLAADVMPGQHQVRILTGNRMLVWDYLVNQWGEWTTSGGLDATIWNGSHIYLTSSGPMVQQTTYTGVNYGFDIETTWIKVTDLQGRGIVRMVELLGEYRGSHSLRVRLARNYESDGAGGWSYNYDKVWAVTPTVVGGPEQLKVAPSIKRPIQAFKVRLTALAADQVSQPSGETAKLSGIAVAIAIEGDLYSGLPAAQKG